MFRLLSHVPSNVRPVGFHRRANLLKSCLVNVYIANRDSGTNRLSGIITSHSSTYRHKIISISLNCNRENVRMILKGRYQRTVFISRGTQTPSTHRNINTACSDRLISHSQWFFANDPRGDTSGHLVSIYLKFMGH